MGGISMNENLDLTKILEGCPEGTEFYCPLCGNLRLVKISSSLIDAVELCIDEDNPPFTFSREGYFYYTYRNRSIECLLFPSKDQRDWSKFVRFWDKPKTEEPMVEVFDINTLQPFDKVLVRDFLNEDWMADFFERIDENDVHYNATCVTSHWEQCIPYNDETKHLLGTREDCPEYYKWWEAAQEKIAQDFLNKLKL